MIHLGCSFEGIAISEQLSKVEHHVIDVFFSVVSSLGLLESALSVRSIVAEPGLCRRRALAMVKEGGGDMRAD